MRAQLKNEISWRIAHLNSFDFGVLQQFRSFQCFSVLLMICFKDIPVRLDISGKTCQQAIYCLVESNFSSMKSEA
jgi:hypothetical protein